MVNKHYIRNYNIIRLIANEFAILQKHCLFSYLSVADEKPIKIN